MRMTGRIINFPKYSLIKQTFEMARIISNKHLLRAEIVEAGDDEVVHGNKEIHMQTLACKERKM